MLLSLFKILYPSLNKLEACSTSWWKAKDGLGILWIEDDETMRDGHVQVLKRADHQAIRMYPWPWWDWLSAAKKSLIWLKTDYRMKRDEWPGGMETELKIWMRIWRNSHNCLWLPLTWLWKLWKKGASDYVTSLSPLSANLTSRIDKVLKFRESGQARSAAGTRENKYLRGEIDVQYNFGEIVGFFRKKWKKLFERIQKLAKSNSSVLIIWWKR